MGNVKIIHENIITVAVHCSRKTDVGIIISLYMTTHNILLVLLFMALMIVNSQCFFTYVTCMKILSRVLKRKFK